MLGSGRYFYKPFEPIPKVIASRLSVRQNKVATAVADEKSIPPSEKDVVIPPRIERGPTDILKALASTVGYDPTSAGYKYPDDPAFQCNSMYHKKLYALALESGKRSAKWIIENNPSLFQHNASEPHIKAFRPKLIDQNKAEFSEKDLICAIEERNVVEAISVYESLKKNSCEVSQSTKQCLLELVCFYNCNPVPAEDVEARWFGINKLDTDKSNTWRKEGFAETLYQEMDSDCPLAKSALIQGRLKFNDLESAKELFQEAKNANINLSVEVYNLLIEKDFFDVMEKPMFFEVLLKEMSEKGIKPNLGTLNAVLTTLSKPSVFFKRKIWADKAWDEFLGLGIEPSLGSYGLLLYIISKVMKNKEIGFERGKENFLRILDEVEKKEHEIRHSSDFKFFVNVMNAICTKIEDADVALRIVDLYFSNNNMKFINKEVDLQVIIRNICCLVLQKKPMDFAMNFIRRYLLRLFYPDVSLFTNIFQAIELNYAPEYLPEIWNYLQQTGFAYHRVVLAKLLKLVNSFSDEESLKIFHAAARNALQKTEEFNRVFTEEGTFSDILTVLAKNSDEEGILKFFDFVKGNELVVLNEESLKFSFEYALSKNNSTLIHNLLVLAADKKTLASEMAEKAVPLLSGHEKKFAEKLKLPKRKGKNSKKEKLGEE